jgi:hypothetical protein
MAKTKRAENATSAYKCANPECSVLILNNRFCSDCIKNLSERESWNLTHSTSMEYKNQIQDCLICDKPTNGSRHYCTECIARYPGQKQREKAVRERNESKATAREATQEVRIWERHAVGTGNCGHNLFNVREPFVKLRIWVCQECAGRECRI